jgi:alpha-1,6-mannosyltransferase
MATLPFILIGFAHDNRVKTLTWPPIFFVFLMSFLGHKEWRFIVYVVPMLNIAAASGARILYAFPLID